MNHIFEAKKCLFSLILAACLALTGCGPAAVASQEEVIAETSLTETGAGAAEMAVPKAEETEEESVSQEADPDSVYTWNGDEKIPVYTGDAWVSLNSNQPYFTDEEKLVTEAFENYSDLDTLGRCGQAYANICIELMPTEKRGEIGSVKPSGWHTVKYPNIISDLYLYNRCHLIGFQLAGENANEKNLVTGTRYMNIDGMLDFENLINDYVEETNHHVLYRVTPIFHEDDLVCRGVEMEGWSVEDNGEGVCFHVFAYNVQPGIAIDYATGESWAGDGVENSVSVESSNNEAEGNPDSEAQEYVLNISSGKFHLPDCESVAKISDQNRKTWKCTKEELVEDGYSPCGICNP